MLEIACDFIVLHRRFLKFKFQNQLQDATEYGRHFKIIVKYVDTSLFNMCARFSRNQFNPNIVQAELVSDSCLSGLYVPKWVNPSNLDVYRTHLQNMQINLLQIWIQSRAINGYNIQM
jgi:hypothetical protein